MCSVDVVVALANCGVTVTQDHVLEVRLPVLIDDIEVCVNDKEEVCPGGLIHMYSIMY